MDPLVDLQRSLLLILLQPLRYRRLLDLLLLLKPLLELLVGLHLVLLFLRRVGLQADLPRPLLLILLQPLLYRQLRELLMGLKPLQELLLILLRPLLARLHLGPLVTL
jgi:hypothetical protein